MMSVVKKDNVKVADPVSLSDSPSVVQGGGELQSGPQAQIIKQDATHAVVEVICTCGTKVHLNCQYAAPAS